MIHTRALLSNYIYEHVRIYCMALQLSTRRHTPLDVKHDVTERQITLTVHDMLKVVAYNLKGRIVCYGIQVIDYTLGRLGFT